jgi:predicted DNA-binding transcriptional regulator YafY
VPVYAERGAEGGCALIDSYRTTLTGLTQPELRALFVLTIPDALEALGMDDELRSALRKVSAALPASRRDEEIRVRQRLHLDASAWFQAGEAVPHLATIQSAIWEDRKLYLVHKMDFFDTPIERTVAPYGLVAKAGVWYVVCAWENRMTALRVARVVAAQLTDEPFTRPQGFDLAAFWKQWCSTYEWERRAFWATVRVAPEMLRLLPFVFGDHTQTAIDVRDPPDADGWVTVKLPFESLAAARERILGMGRAVEVHAPAALRHSVLDFARQIVAFYESTGE